MNSNQPMFTRFQPDQIYIPANDQGNLHPPKTAFVLDSEGCVACVGTREEVQSWVCSIVDQGASVATDERAEGNVILPGFSDTHYHPALFSVFSNVGGVNVSQVASIDEMLEVIRRTPLDGGGVLLFHEYDSSKFGSIQEFPLNDIHDSRPIFIIDRSLHAGIANRKGAEIFHAYLQSRYPGSIFPGEFSDNGNFTETYVFLALEVAEEYLGIEDVCSGIRQKIESSIFHGITSIHELLVFTWNQLLSYLQLIKDWHMKNPNLEFPVRRIFLDERILLRLESQAGELEKNGLFTQDVRRLMGVKFFADGAFGSHTARVSEPYADSQSCHGVSVTDFRKAEQTVQKLLNLGMNKIAIHCIGDVGILEAIRFAWKSKKICESSGMEPDIRFEHFELPLRDSVRAVCELDATISMQSNFGLEDIIYHDRLGERVYENAPHAAITLENVRMMFGTDGMPESMMYLIWAAMHHPNSRHRLSFIDAIMASSRAASLYEGRESGLMREGMKNDLVIASSQVITSFEDGSRAERYIENVLTHGAKTEGDQLRQQVLDLESQAKAVYFQGIPNPQKIF